MLSDTVRMRRVQNIVSVLVLFITPHRVRWSATGILLRARCTRANGRRPKPKNEKRPPTSKSPLFFGKRPGRLYR